MYTGSSAFLDALSEASVSYIFANFGSDHPALVEAIAEARATGKAIPQVVTCPNEMVGMSAAHGFWQVSGVAQAVVVHVECGTQALAGAVHNADKGRASMLIYAGASPFTQEGELPGSRNEFIHWIQDVHKQRDIVSGYMRYDVEIKTGRNIKQLVHRALQFANSDPKGPVYVMGAREVMEEVVPPLEDTSKFWPPVAPTALSSAAMAEIGAALKGARFPLVVTSYLGRNPKAVAPLVALCESLGIGVLESIPNAVNFPRSHPLYVGSQWNQPVQNPILAEADVILVVDSDVPWIPLVSRPANTAKIFHIDVDPLKQQMPLWHINTTSTHRADPATALGQLAQWARANPVDASVLTTRVEACTAHHTARLQALASAEKFPEMGEITPEFMVARIRAAADASTIFVSEAISNYGIVSDHLMLDRPGAMMTSGGGALGYNGGAAIGAKLASPDSTVIAICGDGSFMFSVPSSVHWMARRYETPFLQIVINNRGWRSPKLSALAVHPKGYASRANDLDTSFEPPSDYVGIAAAAGGAWGRQVVAPADLDAALAEALRVVREEKRCAVLDIWMAHH